MEHIIKDELGFEVIVKTCSYDSALVELNLYDPVRDASNSITLKPHQLLSLGNALKALYLCIP